MKLRRSIVCLFLVSIVCMVVVTQAFAETVGYWRFEDGKEGAVASTAVDASGKGHDGEGFNLMLGAFGMVDEAEEALRYSTDVPVSTIPLTGEENKYSMFFDGEDDCFVMDPMVNDFPDYTFTLEAYFKVDENLNEQQESAIVGIWPCVLSQDRFQMSVYKINGRVYPAAAIGHPNAWWGILTHLNYHTDYIYSLEILSDYPGLEVGKWYHMAFTFEPSVAKLYIDGELVIEAAAVAANGTVIDKFNLDSAEPLKIGRTIPGRAFRGWIDEVRISNKVLSPEEFLCATK